MGMRSEIYVAWRNDDKRILVARYHQWCFSERMLSRAVGILGFLQKAVEWPHLLKDKDFKRQVEMACDINFDYRDIVLSRDLTHPDFKGDKYNIFTEQDCNDGKLFMLIADDNRTIKYCFTDYTAEEPLDAEQYLKWDLDGEDLDEKAKERSNYLENIETLRKEAVLMTKEELQAFMEADYGDINKGLIVTEK